MLGLLQCVDQCRQLGANVVVQVCKQALAFFGRGGLTRQRQLVGQFQIEARRTLAFATQQHASVQRPEKREQHRQCRQQDRNDGRSEEHTSELQSLMRNAYAVFCLKKKKHNKKQEHALIYIKSTHTDITNKAHNLEDKTKIQAIQRSTRMQLRIQKT